MSVPNFMEVPDMPRPTKDGPTYPHVISQLPQDDGTVLVVFALPGLRRYSVRVPQSIWLAGEHLSIGANVHRTFDSFLPSARSNSVDASGYGNDDAS